MQRVKALLNPLIPVFVVGFIIACQAGVPGPARAYAAEPGKRDKVIIKAADAGVAGVGDISSGPLTGGVNSGGTPDSTSPGSTTRTGADTGKTDAGVRR